MGTYFNLPSWLLYSFGQILSSFSLSLSLYVCLSFCLCLCFQYLFLSLFHSLFIFSFFPSICLSLFPFSCFFKLLSLSLSHSLIIYVKHMDRLWDIVGEGFTLEWNWDRQKGLFWCQMLRAIWQVCVSSRKKITTRKTRYFYFYWKFFNGFLEIKNDLIRCQKTRFNHIFMMPSGAEIVETTFIFTTLRRILVIFV